MATPLRLPAGHALDWFQRSGEEHEGASIVSQTARTVTLDLPDAALADLISDAIYYAEEMDRENTGDADYRGKAHTALRALGKHGVIWERRRGTFIVRLIDRP